MGPCNGLAVRIVFAVRDVTGKRLERIGLAR